MQQQQPVDIEAAAAAIQSRAVREFPSSLYSYIALIPTGTALSAIYIYMYRLGLRGEYVGERRGRNGARHALARVGSVLL